MDEHLVDLVGGVGVFALLGVVAIQQELAVTIFDDALGVPLDFVHYAQDFADFSLECAGFAVENIAVGVGAGVAIIHEFGVAADHAVVALDELEQPEDTALVHGAEDKWRTRAKKIVLDVFAVHHYVSTMIGVAINCSTIL